MPNSFRSKLWICEVLLPVRVNHRISKHCSSIEVQNRGFLSVTGGLRRSVWSLLGASNRLLSSVDASVILSDCYFTTASSMFKFFAIYRCSEVLASFTNPRRPLYLRNAKGHSITPPHHASALEESADCRDGTTCLSCSAVSASTVEGQRDPRA